MTDQLTSIGWTYATGYVTRNAVETGVTVEPRPTGDAATARR